MGYIHFFDDWQLISYSNLERRMGRPRYVPEATLEDELTEGTWNFPTVARLPETGRYVGLYGAACATPRTAGNRIARTQVLCYAESDDGVEWRRPDLSGEVSFPGPVYAPNQVFGSEQLIDGMPVYYDTYDPDPGRRFKYFVNITPGIHEPGPRGLAVSPDGKHWSLAQVFDQLEAIDTPSSVFYNPEDQVYVINGRREGGDRRVFFRTTRDWQTFTEPRLVMHPGPEDPPLVGFYGMPVVRYETLYLGLLWWIYCDPGSHGLPNGPIECALAYSHDGWTFNRTFHRPLIGRNEMGDHGGGCVYVSSMMVDEHNVIRFYSGGSKAEHFQRQDLADAALMLHTLRLDGFMYFATHAGRGRLRTRPLKIRGGDLRINARSPWAGIRVRILDERGQELPGFGFEDCDPLVGDELFWTPRWTGGKTFGHAQSPKRRSLEIDICTGEIYAIRGDFDVMTCLWHTDE